MKKLIPFLLALCCLILCACASKPQEKAAVPEPEALAAELLASGAFSEELGAVEDVVARTMYVLTEDEVASIRLYSSSGAVSEEIAILPCADEAAAGKALAECSARLELQKRLYADYKPEEVPKLEKALVVQRGRTVVLCVAADAGKAKAVLDKYF